MTFFITMEYAGTTVGTIQQGPFDTFQQMQEIMFPAWKKSMGLFTNKILLKKDKDTILQIQGATAIDPRVEGVLFSLVEIDEHIDARRHIQGETIRMPSVFAKAIARSGVLQTKTIVISAATVEQGWVLGNHYHPVESDFYECFVVSGPEDSLFHLYYVEKDGDVPGEIYLQSGMVCMIPPGIVHTFKPLQHGAKLTVFSNKTPDLAHNVLHRLL